LFSREDGKKKVKPNKKINKGEKKEFLRIPEVFTAVTSEKGKKISRTRRAVRDRDR